MGGGGPLIMYKCAVCHVYFDNYTKATIHLGVEHSSACLKLKNKNITTTKSTGDTDQEVDGELIQPIEFSESHIWLERLSPEKLPECTNEPDSDLKTPSSLGGEISKLEKKRKSVLKVAAKGQRRQEIKLDTLKAGEIETLINDLYTAASKSAHDSESSVRKSNRKVKERFKKNYGELDSCDEEVIRTGSSKNAKTQDGSDFSDIDVSGSDSEQDFSSDGSMSRHSGGWEKVSDESMLKPYQLHPNSMEGTTKEHEKDKNGNNNHDNLQRIETSSDSCPLHRYNYWCRICNIKFVNRDYLQHMRTNHLKDDKYTCPTCQESFPLLSVFNFHLDKHQNPRSLYNKSKNDGLRDRYLCRVCKLEFSKQKVYKKHMVTKHFKKGKYTCNLCRESFSQLNHFNVHMDKHTNPKSGMNKSIEIHDSLAQSKYTYPCDICPKTFHQLYNLNRHKECHERRINYTENLNKSQVCPICQHRYTLKTALRDHFLTHLENNPLKCKFPECAKTFTNLKHLKRHIQLHIDRVSYDCKQCPATYFHKKGLTRHTKRFHSENSKETYKRVKNTRKYSVKSAQELTDARIKTKPTDSNDDSRFEIESIHLQDRIITIEGQTDIHIKGETLSPEKRRRPSHSGTDDEESKDFELAGSDSDDTVTESILSDPAIKKIQPTHPELVQSIIFTCTTRRKLLDHFKCTKCPWSGRSMCFLQKHMKNCHETSIELFTVEETTESQPLSDKPLILNFTCGTCGFQSKSCDDLSSHIAKVHVKDKKFPCLVCGLRFTKKSVKDLHEQTVHLTDKKFSCDKCGTKFSSINYLNIHLKKKHDPTFKSKTFKCQQCGAVFKQKYNYVGHLRLHTDKKELSTCKICKQTCANIYSLKRHIQLVHLRAVNLVQERQKQKKMQAKVESTGQIVNEEEKGVNNAVSVRGMELDDSQRSLQLNSSNQSVQNLTFPPNSDTGDINTDCSEILGF